MVWCGAAMAVISVCLLRFAWGRTARSPTLLTAAWSLLLASLVAGGVAEGAWGVTMAALAAMTCACIFLAHAAVVSPTVRTQERESLRDRGSPAKDQNASPRQIARRLTTFILAVPVAFVSSLLIGLAVRGLGDVAGWHSADSNALAFFIVPIAWSLLLSMMLMTTRRRVQGLILGIPAGVSLMVLTGIFL